MECPFLYFFFSSRRRHTRCSRDWSSDVCSSDLREARKSRCRVGAAEGGAPMKTPLDVSLAPMIQPIAAPAAELDRLGDEIAELSAHLDAATARLLDLIRDFDARGGWNTGFLSCAHWLCWRVGVELRGGPGRGRRGGGGGARARRRRGRGPAGG